MTTTVVCGGEDCEQLTASESLEAVHNALVSSQDIAASVGLEEVLYTVRAELDNVTCAIGVSDEVRLDS